MEKNSRRWIYRNARPLDLARWQYHFEQGDKEPVLLPLLAYQNPDGGFGHALEADCWNPESSPLQTWAATAILKEIKFTDRHHPIVRGILDYLGSGRHFKDGRWALTIPSNDDSPHAPWWTFNEQLNSSSYNPTASLAGFCLAHAEEGSDLYQLASRIAGEAVAYYLDFGPSDSFHTLCCYIELADYCKTARIDGLFDQDALGEKLVADVRRLLHDDADKWGREYACRPSVFIHSMESAFYPGNEELVRRECEFLSRTQAPDGTWEPSWNWSGYPDEWSVSRNWWKASLAIDNILFLKRMGQA